MGSMLAFAYVCVCVFKCMCGAGWRVRVDSIWLVGVGRRRLAACMGRGFQCPGYGE